VPLFCIETGTDTAKAVPPEEPGGTAGELGIIIARPGAAAPPMPATVPLLIKVTPFGKAPSMVKPGVPVDVALTITPALIVACTALVPAHPAAIAAFRKLTSLPDNVKANVFDLP
jgi:hypothetical protein